MLVIVSMVTLVDIVSAKNLACVNDFAFLYGTSKQPVSWGSWALRLVKPFPVGFLHVYPFPVGFFFLRKETKVMHMCFATVVENWIVASGE